MDLLASRLHSDRIQRRATFETRQGSCKFLKCCTIPQIDSEIRHCVAGLKAKAGGIFYAILQIFVPHACAVSARERQLAANLQRTPDRPLLAKRRDVREEVDELDYVALALTIQLRVPIPLFRSCSGYFARHRRSCLMPPLFHCTSVSMEDETRNRRRDLPWALPTSLILHGLLITVLVVYGQPRLPQQQQEEAVNVTLMPPPEQPKSKPAAPPSSKDPDAEKPPEPELKQLPASEGQPSKPAQIEVLKPVFRFGDKDAGPGKSLEGDSAQGTSPSPAKGGDLKSPSEERPDAANDTAKQAAAAKDTESAQDVENEAASNQDIGKRETDQQEDLVDGADKQTAVAPMPLGVAGNDGEIALPALAKAPQPRPANAPKPSLAKIPKPGNGSTMGPGSKNVDVATSQPYSGLPGVRRLQSQGATGDAMATTSMAGVPRDKRAAKLCASALQQQLLDASYSPDLVPLVPLKRGNVLDVPEAAFRTRTAWHALSFRCEVDTDATTILSLTFRVGATIPRDQWARLGLPAND